MDDELRILNAAAMPAALDALDDRILHMLAIRQRDASAMGRMVALAAFISLGGGVVAGSVFVPSPVAARSLTPLAPVSSLAPSTLLDPR